MKTWYDAGYVIERYNEESGRNSHHERIALRYRDLLDEANRKIAIQDAELALAKKMREQKRAASQADEPEMMC